MVQVHVPQGVGVRVPPWAPCQREKSSRKRAFFSPTSKAPARFTGGTRKRWLASHCGVAARDRVPPWAPGQREKSSRKRAFFSPSDPQSIQTAIFHLRSHSFARHAARPMKLWKNSSIFVFRSPVTQTLAISLLLLGLYNWRFWQATFTAFVDKSGGLLFMASLLTVLVLLHMIFLLLIPERRLIKIFAGFLFFISAFAAYAADTYGTQIDADMIRNIVQTDQREAFALFNLRFVFYMVVMGFIPTAMLWMSQINYLSWQRVITHRAGFIVVALLIVVGLIAIQSAHYALFIREHKNLRFWLIPGSTLNASFHYVKSIAPAAADLPFEPAPPTARQSNISHVKNTKPLLLFLVVGETVRAANVQLGGYARATTPMLSSMPDVYYFNNVWSCGTATAISLPCMFSPMGRTAFDPARAERTAGLLDALALSDVELEWRDNNSGSKGAGNRIKTIENYRTRSPSFCNDASCYDEVMLEDLPERIANINTDTTIVFHQIGSHGPAYAKRYPERFNVFKPVCKTNMLNECSADEIRNAYDNSIVYTDHNLARQIAILRKFSARFDSMLIYVSDHGESLGEKGLYLHGAPYMFAPDEQKHVPFLIWMSEGYKARRYVSDSCLQQTLSHEYSHDNLYSTVLGAMERRNSFYQPKMDILAACSGKPASGITVIKTQR